MCVEIISQLRRRISPAAVTKLQAWWSLVSGLAQPCRHLCQDHKIGARVFLPAQSGRPATETLGALNATPLLLAAAQNDGAGSPSHVLAFAGRQFATAARHLPANQQQQQHTQPHSILQQISNESPSADNTGKETLAAALEALQPPEYQAKLVAAAQGSNWKTQLLPALTTQGLKHNAAMAVQKVFHEGFHSSALQHWGHPDLTSHRQQQTSAVRLLARVRRLLRAHQAAAASLGQPSAAAVAAAVQSQLPGAAAAGAGGGAPAAKQWLTWGQLDIHAVIARDPGVLLVPPKQLEARLNALLSGLAAVSSPNIAIDYVQSCHCLTSDLGNPYKVPKRIDDIRRVYAEVLGVEPHPRLFSAAESSFLRNTETRIQQKLQQLMERFDAPTVHALLSHQPHLLSSNPQTLLDNVQLLQQLLGVSDADLKLLVVKAPRILSSSCGLLAKYLEQLRLQLGQLGMTKDQIRTTVMKEPMLLLWNPVTIAAKIEGLKDLLGTATRLAYLLQREPRLLFNSPDTLHHKIQELVRLLDLNQAQMQQLITRHPLLLSLRPQLIKEKFDRLQEVLSANHHQMVTVVRCEPHILLLSPESVQVKVKQIAEAMGWQLTDTQGALLSNARVLIYDPSLVVDYLRLLTKLVVNSEHWLDTKLFMTSTTLAKRHYRKAAQSWLQSKFPEAPMKHIPALSKAIWRDLEQWSSKQCSKSTVTSSRGSGMTSDSSINSMMTAPTSSSSHLNGHLHVYHALAPQTKAILHKVAISQHQPRVAKTLEVQAALGKLWHELLAEALQLLQQQQHGSSSSSSGLRGPCWQIRYARNTSGRLLLRLEYLLATGQQEQVAISTANKATEADWAQQHPDYPSWAQLRLQHLQRDPGDWPPALVQKAVSAAAVAAATSRVTTAASGTLQSKHWQGQSIGQAAAATATIESSSSSVVAGVSRRRRSRASGAAAGADGGMATSAATQQTAPGLQQAWQQEPGGFMQPIASGSGSSSSDVPLGSIGWPSNAGYLPGWVPGAVPATWSVYTIAAAATSRSAAAAEGAVGAVAAASLPNTAGYAANTQPSVQLYQQQQAAASSLSQACSVLPAVALMQHWFAAAVDADSTDLNGISSSNGCGGLPPSSHLWDIVGLQAVSALSDLWQWAALWSSSTSNEANHDSSYIDVAQSQRWYQSARSGPQSASLSDVLRKRSQLLSQQFTSTADQGASKRHTGALYEQLWGAVMA